MLRPKKLSIHLIIFLMSTFVINNTIQATRNHSSWDDQSDCDESKPLNEIQVRGSHNSYHLMPKIPLTPEWKYSHPNLAEQLESYDLRQFELDLQWNKTKKLFDVYHVPVVDNRTTCKTLHDCLQQVRNWTKSLPDHELIYLMLELKDSPKKDSETLKRLQVVEQTILDVFPKQNIFTPDNLRGDHQNLKEAIHQDGWPSYGSLRGKVMFLIEAKREVVGHYTKGHKHLQGKLIFPFVQSKDMPYGVVATFNDPIKDQRKIMNAASKGMIIRTRADSSLKKNFERRDTALMSKANIISTDFFRPSRDYWVHFPKHQIWRCRAK